MLVVFGLGNPGDEYSNTRHNFGKQVVLKLGQRLNKKFLPGRGNFLYCADDLYDLRLVISTKFINVSGIVAIEIVKAFGILDKDLLVVCDDFNLPLGTIRLRKSGGDGGHNGLASVIYHLGSEGFPRLRLGIGAVPQDTDSSQFVLSDFNPDEIGIVNEVTERAGESILFAALHGVEQAMNIYNRRQSA